MSFTKQERYAQIILTQTKILIHMNKQESVKMHLWSAMSTLYNKYNGQFRPISSFSTSIFTMHVKNSCLFLWCLWSLMVMKYVRDFWGVQWQANCERLFFGVASLFWSLIRAVMVSLNFHSVFFLLLYFKRFSKYFTRSSEI